MGNELFSSESTLNYRRRILKLDNLVDNDYDYEYLFEDEFYELYDITYEGFKKIYVGKTASDDEKVGGIYRKDPYILNKLNDITVNHSSKNSKANGKAPSSAKGFADSLHDGIKKMIQEADNELTSEQKCFLANSCGFPKKGGFKKDCVFKKKSCISKESCEFRKKSFYLRPYSADAIRHWISPGNGDKRNISEREYIFQMSFALDLPLAKFNEYKEDGTDSNEKGYPVYTHQGFCHKILNQKYCINSPDELCMMYCKYYSLEYTDALKLYADFLKKSEELSENENSDTKNDASSAKSKKKEETKENTRSNLDNLIFNLDKRDDNAFLQSLVEYREQIKPDIVAITDYIKNKINEIFEEKNVCEKFYNNVYYDFDAKFHNKWLLNTFSKDFIMILTADASGFFSPAKNEAKLYNDENYKSKRVFFDYIYPGVELKLKISDKKKAFKNKDYQMDFFPELCVNIVNENSGFSPTRTYYERCRKSIIIVKFFEFGVNALIGKTPTSDKDGYYQNSKNFIQELNDKLTSFNMPTLYPYNKFDQLIMWASKTKEPLKMYYETILNVQKKLLLRLKENFQDIINKK